MGRLPLLQAVLQSQAAVLDAKALFIGFVGVQAADEARLAKQETQVVDGVQFRLESFVGVNGEVGRNRSPLLFSHAGIGPRCPG